MGEGHEGAACYRGCCGRASRIASRGQALPARWPLVRRRVLEWPERGEAADPMTRTTSALLIAASLLAGTASAQVYRWTDKDGTVHYSEEPPPEGQPGRKLELPEEERTKPGSSGDQREARREEAAPRTAPPPQPGRPFGAPPKAKCGALIDLYTTSWCPWCKKARDYFNGRGVAFVEHDIEATPGPVEVRYGLDVDRRVPAAIICGRLVRGFSPEQYQAALGRN